MEEQLLLFDDPRKKTNRFASQQDMAEYIEENCRWNKVNFYSVAETAAFLCLSEDEVEHLIEYYYLDAVHIEGVVRIPYNAILRYIEDDGAERMRRRSYYTYIASNGGGESR